MKKNSRRHLTDFLPDELSWYQHSVNAFGKSTFGISKKSMHGHQGQLSLWTTRKGDCSDFWAQHKKSKKAVGFKYSWEK